MKKTLVLTLLLIYGLISFGQNKVVSQREVYDKMVEAEISHPVIVLKQAIHESANFKYKRAIQQNNYLGLLDKKRRLIAFDSIEDCIRWYKEKVQSRYLGGNYWHFLKRIGYAEDKQYKHKVSKIQLEFEVE